MSQLTVLVVDDETGIHEGLAEILALSFPSVQVVTADSVDSVLAWIDETIFGGDA